MLTEEQGLGLIREALKKKKLPNFALHQNPLRYNFFEENFGWIVIYFIKYTHHWCWWEKMPIMGQTFFIIDKYKETIQEVPMVSYDLWLRAKKYQEENNYTKGLQHEPIFRKDATKWVFSKIDLICINGTDPTIRNWLTIQFYIIFICYPYRFYKFLFGIKPPPLVENLGYKEPTQNQ